MIGIILSSCRKTVTSSIQHFFLQDFGRGYHCNKCWSLANFDVCSKKCKNSNVFKGQLHYFPTSMPVLPGKSLLFLHFEANKQAIRHLPSLRFLTLILLDDSTSKMQTSDQSPSPGDSPIRYNVGNGKRRCPIASVVGISFFTSSFHLCSDFWGFQNALASKQMPMIARSQTQRHFQPHSPCQLQSRALNPSVSLTNAGIRRYPRTACSSTSNVCRISVEFCPTNITHHPHDFL